MGGACDIEHGLRMEYQLFEGDMYEKLAEGYTLGLGRHMLRVQPKGLYLEVPMLRPPDDRQRSRTPIEQGASHARARAFDSSRPPGDRGWRRLPHAQDGWRVLKPRRRVLCSDRRACAPQVRAIGKTAYAIQPDDNGGGTAVQRGLPSPACLGRGADRSSVAAALMLPGQVAERA